MVPKIENLILYDQWCVSFINDHRQYFNEDTAQAAIDYFIDCINVGAFILDNQQIIRFQIVARGLYQQGFWANAGILNDIKIDTE